jgi:hypothetical protein
MNKTSEIIKNECCGIGLLTIEKEELVKQVKTLEAEKDFLENQLKNAIAKIQSDSKK